MSYVYAIYNEKNVLGYLRYLHMIEYCRLNIEYLRFACGGSVIRKTSTNQSMLSLIFFKDNTIIYCEGFRMP
jgi:hypothetical protein